MKKITMLLVALMVTIGVSAQDYCISMDSLMIFPVPGYNPMTMENDSVIATGAFTTDYVVAWVVRPNHTDTVFSIPYLIISNVGVSVPFVGLLPGTDYITGAYCVFSGKKTAVANFQTALCPYVAIMSHTPAGCRDTLHLFPRGSQYTYQIKFGGVIIPGAISPDYVVENSGIYTGIVSSGSCALSTQPISVTINPVTVNITGPSSVCAGSAVTLTASGSDSATYSWSNGMTGKSIYYVPTTGSISVTETVNGCTGSASKSITIKPLPMVNITSPSSNIKLCVNNLPYALKADRENVEWSGKGVNGDQFTPSNSNVGSNVITCKYRDPNTGCFGRDSVIARVLNPPVVDSGSINNVAGIGPALFLFGNFQDTCEVYPNYLPKKQYVSYAMFENFPVLHKGDWVYVNYARVNGCETTFKWIKDVMGIQEIGIDFVLKKNEVINLVDMSGKVFSIKAPNDLKIYQVQKLLDLPTGYYVLYIERSSQLFSRRIFIG